MKTFQIYTLDEHKYQELSAQALSTDLYIVDDADDAHRTVVPSYDLLIEKTKGLSGAIHFKGVLDKLPPADGFDSGDIVIVGTKEFILQDIAGKKSWKEIGDEATWATKVDVERVEKKLETVHTDLTKRIDITDGRLNEVKADLAKRIEDESNRALAAEDSFSTKLSKEISLRESDLQKIIDITEKQKKAIADEVARAQAAETGIDSKLAAETSRAEKAEKELDKAIASERERASTKEKEILADQVKMQEDFKNFKHDADKRINDEVARATSVEKALSAAVDDEHIVRYSDYPGQAGRKVIVLSNHDELAGTLADGSDGVNLAMLSKWDVADFGSVKVHANINTKDVVTINDSLSVATTADVDDEVARAKEAEENLVVQIIPSNSTDFLALYKFMQGSEEIGMIDIPKDFLVKSGSVKTCDEEDVPEAGYHVGDKYIDLVVNAKDAPAEESHIYILVKDLVDAYVAGPGLELKPGNMFLIATGYRSMISAIPEISSLLDSKIEEKATSTLTSDTGTARLFNEADGGGAKFEHKDGTESYVGVNNGGEDGLAAQIYADKLVDGKWQGAKLDVTLSGIYYTVGDKPAAERDVPANLLATYSLISALQAQVDALTEIVSNLSGSLLFEAE